MKEIRQQLKQRISLGNEALIHREYRQYRW